MILRIIYTIKHTWLLRQQLETYVSNRNLQIKNICSITPEYLQEAGIHALVLDYDGVLAAHGEPEPRAEVIAWLQQFSQTFAPRQIYILSNKPTPQRQEYFQQHFPHIVFVIAPRKKPYPDGLLQIIHQSGLAPAQIVLIDDRLCTGILATLLTGVQGRLITQPYINYKHRLLAEIWFVFLRWLEKTAVNCL